MWTEHSRKDLSVPTRPRAASRRMWRLEALPDDWLGPQLGRAKEHLAQGPLPVAWASLRMCPADLRPQGG